MSYEEGPFNRQLIVLENVCDVCINSVSFLYSVHVEC